MAFLSAWSSCRQPVSCLVFLVMPSVFYQCGSGLLELQVAYITTNEGQYVSNGSRPAVMLAIDEVNKAFSDQYHLQISTTEISVSVFTYGLEYIIIMDTFATSCSHIVISNVNMSLCTTYTRMYRSFLVGLT